MMLYIYVANQSSNPISTPKNGHQRFAAWFLDIQFSHAYQKLRLTCLSKVTNILGANSKNHHKFWAASPTNPNWANEKNPCYFPYHSLLYWLLKTGILIPVYYKSHLTGVVFHPPKNPKTTPGVLITAHLGTSTTGEPLRFQQWTTTLDPEIPWW